MAVSYTHLDVYKRQPYFLAEVGRYAGDGSRLAVENLSGDIRHYLQ